LAAAALAAVIALGFVFAANQGNEATESVTESRVSQAEKDAWNSRVDFLTQQYHMRQASQPTVNIEKYRMEKAGLIGAITPSTSPEAYKALQQQAGVASVFSPELARIQALNTARLQAMWDQRYQDLIDRFENQMVPNGHEAFNPSILVTIPEPLFSPELARLQAVNTARLQAMWSQRYQDLIDRFENQMVPNGHDVFSPEAAKAPQAAPQQPREKRS
jgi:hypothetical protein